MRWDEFPQIANPTGCTAKIVFLSGFVIWLADTLSWSISHAASLRVSCEDRGKRMVAALARMGKADMIVGGLEDWRARGDESCGGELSALVAAWSLLRFSCVFLLSALF